MDSFQQHLADKGGHGSKTTRIISLASTSPGGFTARELSDLVDCTTAMVYRIADLHALKLKVVPRRKHGNFKPKREPMKRDYSTFVEMPPPPKVQTIVERIVELAHMPEPKPPKPTPDLKEDRLRRMAAAMLEERWREHERIWGFLP